MTVSCSSSLSRFWVINFWETFSNRLKYRNAAALLLVETFLRFTGRHSSFVVSHCRNGCTSTWSTSLGIFIVGNLMNEETIIYTKPTIIGRAKDLFQLPQTCEAGVFCKEKGRKQFSKNPSGLSANKYSSMNQ